MAQRNGGTILILGGAGLVGLQVAREAVRELHPARIVISALTQNEVDEAIAVLRNETRDVEFVPAAGDIFLPQSLQGIDRAELIANRKHYDALFSEESSLLQLVQQHQPEVIVDCINTATAIAYLDVITVTERTRMLLDAVESRSTPIDPGELQPLIRSVRELMIAQGVPQIVRHILVLHRALESTSVRVYVKVGTTGTGGMGINIPYTHSEDKPSPQLLSKSAIGFAHTGLLFLLARTPGASIIKEMKPGAMIGFKRLGETHVRLRGDRRNAYLIEPREEPLGDSLDTHQAPESYRQFEGRDVPLKMIGADTGEHGCFTIGVSHLACEHRQYRDYDRHPPAEGGSTSHAGTTDQHPARPARPRCIADRLRFDREICTDGMGRSAASEFRAVARASRPARAVATG